MLRGDDREMRFFFMSAWVIWNNRNTLVMEGASVDAFISANLVRTMFLGFQLATHI